jgi:hypothetical protein
MKLDKKQVWKGLVGVSIAIPIVVLIFLLLAAIFPMPSQGAELNTDIPKVNPWPFPEPPYIEFGVDYSFETVSVFCEPPYPDKLEKLHSNIRLGQTLIKHGNYSIEVAYTHNSCAFNYDRGVNDAIGFVYRWSPWSTK